MKQGRDGPRARRHSAQHDDHCILTFYGANWRIVSMQGLGFIRLRTLDGFYGGALSLDKADLESYCEKSVAWLAPDMAIDNAETRG